MRTYLFYIHALSGGGAERVWSVLASSLAERGHRVTIAVDYQASDNLPYLSPAVRLHVLGGSHATVTLRLMRLIKAMHPDVVVAALAASNVKVTLAAMGAGVLSRTILTYHGYAESEPQRLSQIGYYTAPLLSRLTARTICVSDGLLHYMRRRWGAAASKTVRLYNPVGVTSGAAIFDAPALAARDPIVLAVGRLVSYKNFIELIRAFADVEPIEARLIILGQGPERAAIEHEVARLGLQDRVSLPGYVPDPSVIYAQARCFVLPSRSESFGLVVVEALAHGLPVVATACDGPIEILTTQELGTIVPRGDTRALADAISATLASPGDPQQRICRAADFSVAQAADRYEDLLESVASQQNKGQPRTAHGLLRPAGIALAMMATAFLMCVLSHQVHARQNKPLRPAIQRSSRTPIVGVSP